MKIVRDKNYYEQLKVESNKMYEKVRGYIALANFYKKIFLKTYKRKGKISTRIARFAAYHNQKCIELGSKIALEHIRWMLGEFIILGQSTEEEP